MRKFVIHVQRDPLTDTTSLYIAKYEDGKMSVPKITWEPIGEGVMQNPVFTQSDQECHTINDAFQQLANSLYDAKYVQTAIKGSTGQLEATQKHLDTVTRLLDTVLPSAMRKP